jgi:ribose 1,5-bisphosphokinase PhnN
MDGHGVSVTRNENRIVMLAGPSGSGKSTLARQILAYCPGMKFMQKAVTRPKKEGENPGDEVVLLDEGRFLWMAKRGLIVAPYKKYGSWYGWFSGCRQGVNGVSALRDSDCITIGDAYSAPAELFRVVPETLLIALHAGQDTLIGRIKGKGLGLADERTRISAAIREAEAGYPWNLPVCDCVISTDQPIESAAREIIEIISRIERQPGRLQIL